MPNERRSSMTLDEISLYWRQMRQSKEKPNVHKLCEGINTLNIAFDGSANILSHHLTEDAWSRIRDDYFDWLVASCNGYFVVFSSLTEAPLASTDAWPETGRVEFYPEKANRKTDVYSNDLRRVNPSIVLCLRWLMAEGRQQTRPCDFEAYEHSLFNHDSPEDEESAREFLERLYSTLEGEAHKSKKIAHRKWWHLFWEANSCSDKRIKNELKRQMADLQTVWGTPPR